MNIRVRFFGSLSEAIGPFADLEVGDDATVGALRRRLAELNGGSATVLETCMVAVNTELEGDGTPLVAGDEVAFLPPVSGG